MSQMSAYFRSIAAFSLIFCVWTSEAVAGGSWRENAPMTAARAKLNAATIGEEIYVAGGAGLSGPKSSFDAYDPIGDFWRPLPPMPIGREQFGMASIDKQIFVSGGLAGNDRSAVLSRELWLYDSGSRTWTQKSSMPLARRGHVLLAWSGKLYAIGGAGEQPSKVMVYDSLKDKWSILPGSLAAPRSSFASAVWQGKLYIIGGLSLTGTPMARMDRFDIASGKWSRLADLSIARSGLVAGVLKDRLHVAGGSTLSPSRTYVEHASFDLKTQTWSNEPPLLSPRHSMAAVTSDGEWHLIGGGSGSGFFTLFTVADMVESFRPSN
jgi:N-acetylneuraminic acid mutarotase